MAIPDYQTLMLPVLKMAADGQEHKFSKAVEILADAFSLTDDERNELLPSGSQAVFNNRVGWARSFLKQAGLLNSPKRGFFTITDCGRKLLQPILKKLMLLFWNSSRPLSNSGIGGADRMAKAIMMKPRLKRLRAKRPKTLWLRPMRNCAALLSPRF